MYPNLYYAFKDLFGVDFKFLRFEGNVGHNREIAREHGSNVKLRVSRWRDEMNIRDAHQ